MHILVHNLVIEKSRYDVPLNKANRKDEERGQHLKVDQSLRVNEQLWRQQSKSSLQALNLVWIPGM